jgi:hypothetical protein
MNAAARVSLPGGLLVSIFTRLASVRATSSPAAAKSGDGASTRPWAETANHNPQAMESAARLI